MKHSYFRNLEKVASKDEFPLHVGESFVEDFYDFLRFTGKLSSLTRRGMAAPTSDELREAHVLLEELIVFPDNFQQELNLSDQQVLACQQIAEVWHPIVLDMLLAKGE